MQGTASTLSEKQPKMENSEQERSQIQKTISQFPIDASDLASMNLVTQFNLATKEAEAIRTHLDELEQMAIKDSLAEK